jgi:hypothetical protein
VGASRRMLTPVLTPYGDSPSKLVPGEQTAGGHFKVDLPARLGLTVDGRSAAMCRAADLLDIGSDLVDQPGNTLALAGSGLSVTLHLWRPRSARRRLATCGRLKRLKRLSVATAHALGSRGSSYPRGGGPHGGYRHLCAGMPGDRRIHARPSPRSLPPKRSAAVVSYPPRVKPIDSPGVSSLARSVAASR